MKQKVMHIAAFLLLGAIFMTGCGQNGANTVLPQSSSETALGQVTITPGIHGLGEGWDTEGYSCKDGYYRPLMRRKDSSYNICYTDFSTGQEIIVCSQLNCRHDDESCTGWADAASGRLLPIPVSDKVVLLYSGASGYYDVYGDLSLARVEIMNQDGTNRQLVHKFSMTEILPNMPYIGLARDEENLYFGIEDVTNQSRKLYSVNVVSNSLTYLCDLDKEDEHIVGGTGNGSLFDLYSWCL